MRGRKPGVWYRTQANAYYTTIDGVQQYLGPGPDDGPDGENYHRARKVFLRLKELGQVEYAGNENTVRAVMEAYLRAKEGACRPNVWKIKQRICQLFSDRYGELRVTELKPFHAETIIAEMKKPRETSKGIKKWGPGSRRLFLIQLAAVFAWAIKQELVTRHPFRGIEKPLERTRARERIIEPEEHRAILARLCKPKHASLRNIIIGLEDTGARPGELANATVGDFNPDLGAIVYFADDKRREDEFAHKTSRRKDRVIYFTGEALEMVKKLCGGKKPGEPIFPSQSGKHYKPANLSQTFIQLRAKLGMPHLVPNAYRHTFATFWLTAGRGIEHLAELLGNTPETIRKHYSHLCKRHAALRAQLEAFKRGDTGNRL